MGKQSEVALGPVCAFQTENGEKRSRGDREMIQQVKCLPHKREDMRSEPLHPRKKLSAVMCGYDPSTWLSLAGVSELRV